MRLRVDVAFYGGEVLVHKNRGGKVARWRRREATRFIVFRMVSYRMVSNHQECRSVGEERVSPCQFEWGWGRQTSR